MAGYSLYHPALQSNHFQPKVVTYYFRQWDDFRMPYHEHDAVEIMYVISGKCTVDAVGHLVTMSKGDFIVLDANVRHRLQVDKASPCRMINVEFTFLPKVRDFPSIKDLAAGSDTLQTLLRKSSAYFTLKDPGDVYPTLQSLVMELDAQGSQPGVMLDLLLAELLIRIARLVDDGGEAGLQQADIYTKQVIAYLHQHYDCDVRVRDIAAAVNLHPGYVHRVFKEATGSTIIEYLTALRIEKSKHLLATTDFPVVEIAERVGMNSSQYFSTVFKKRTGLTPLEYRASLVIRQNVPAAARVTK